MIEAIQIIISSSRKHPWLLMFLVVALICHAADLQWPNLHKLFSTAAHGFFSIAAIYAGGSSLSEKQQPPTK